MCDKLLEMGYMPSRSDQSIFMKRSKDEMGGDYWEIIFLYVDDMIIVSREPGRVVDMLKTSFMLRDINETGVFLGGDRGINIKGQRTRGSCTYAMEAIENIERKWKLNLRKETVPMKCGDEPELDNSELLNSKGKTQYQSMIGIGQWLVMLGRIDICYSISSLSRFCSNPRIGHLERLKKVFGWIKRNKYRHFIIDTKSSEFGEVKSIEKMDYEKFQNIYPDAKEMDDIKLPESLIDEMELTIFVDSDHAHDKISRRSVTGIIVFLGKNPIYWLSQRQGAVEGSSYSAEFCAMKKAVEVAIELRYTLRSLGMKIDKPAKVYCDNLAVVNNCTQEESLLKKKHVAVAYHTVREAVAGKIVEVHKVDTKNNLADVFTKSLPGAVMNPLNDIYLHHGKGVIET